LQIPIQDDPELAVVQGVVARGLGRVVGRMESQLASDLPAVRDLCGHVERYRGKMLRPTLALTFGLAVEGRAREEGILEEHVVCAAVCEMVHLATLVHDDVLDEASIRRGGQTVNGLYGNEAAVLLGDFLIAASYHLCSQLDSQWAALAVATASMSTAAGELLQLHHRGDWSIDEATYFEIIERKTGALIALSCELGVRASGGSEEAARGASAFGRRLGVAFQIQDDLLDLVGDQRAVGKPLGRDATLGKLTLPVIHHLTTASPEVRGRSLLLLESLEEGARDPGEANEALRRGLESTGSIEHAREAAGGLVERAKGELGALPESAVRALLARLAEAVLARER